MMVRKITVDIGEEQVMLTRQELRQALEGRAGGAVARGFLIHRADEERLPPSGRLRCGFLEK